MIKAAALALVLVTSGFAYSALWLWWARRKLRRMSEPERLEQMRRWFGD